VERLVTPLLNLQENPFSCVGKVFSLDRGDIGCRRLPQVNAVPFPTPPYSPISMQILADFNFDGKADCIWYNKFIGKGKAWYRSGANFVRDEYIVTVKDLTRKNKIWKIGKN